MLRHYVWLEFNITRLKYIVICVFIEYILVWIILVSDNTILRQMYGKRKCMYGLWIIMI